MGLERTFWCAKCAVEDPREVPPAEATLTLLGERAGRRHVHRPQLNRQVLLVHLLVLVLVEVEVDVSVEGEGAALGGAAGGLLRRLWLSPLGRGPARHRRLLGDHRGGGDRRGGILHQLTFTAPAAPAQSRRRARAVLPGPVSALPRCTVVFIFILLADRDDAHVVVIVLELRSLQPPGELAARAYAAHRRQGLTAAHVTSV